MATSVDCIHCVGCGNDISKSSRGRRKLGPDSTGDSASRNQALLGWKFLIKKQLQEQGIPHEKVMVDLDNPGKMCKHCFNEFKKYYNLQIQLESSLLAALQLIVSSGSDVSTISIPENSPDSQESECKRRCTQPSVNVSNSSSPSVMVRNLNR